MVARLLESRFLTPTNTFFMSVRENPQQGQQTNISTSLVFMFCDSNVFDVWWQSAEEMQVEAFKTYSDPFLKSIGEVSLPFLVLVICL